MPPEIDDSSGVREADILMGGQHDETTTRTVCIERRGEIGDRGDVERVEGFIEYPEPTFAGQKEPSEANPAALPLRKRTAGQIELSAGSRGLSAASWLATITLAGVRL